MSDPTDAPTPPIDPIRDAFAAMLAFFAVLFTGRRQCDTAAERFGDGAAIDVLKKRTQPTARVIVLRDLIARAAEAYKDTARRAREHDRIMADRYALLRKSSAQEPTPITMNLTGLVDALLADNRDTDAHRVIDVVMGPQPKSSTSAVPEPPTVPPQQEQMSADLLATVPAEEQKRIRAMAEKARGETGMRTTAPWAGQAAFDDTIAREVAAYHAQQTSTAISEATPPHVIRDGKADRRGSGLYGRLTGEELQAAHAAHFASIPETLTREEAPPAPAERVTEAELVAARQLISALVSVDDAARYLSEEAEISGSTTSPTVEVTYSYWLDLQTALNTIDRGEGHDAPPGASALTMFDRLAADVRALRATVESLRRRLDVRTAERDRLLARPVFAAEAPHGGDPCAACTAILGSPQLCAMTHDVAPGAYPADASLEARAADPWPDVVRAVDASRPAPAERTYPRVTLGSVAPGSLIEIASGDVGLVLGGSYETAPRHVAYLDDGIARELGASVTVSLRATPAELDALTSADASRPGLTEEEALVFARDTLSRIGVLASLGAKPEQVEKMLSKRYLRASRGAARQRPTLTEEEAQRWGRITVRDVDAGERPWDAVARVLLAASRGDIPAEVRAGDIAVVVSPHDRYLHDGPEETCEWPSCKEARAGAKESS